MEEVYKLGGLMLKKVKALLRFKDGTVKLVEIEIPKYYLINYDTIYSSLVYGLYYIRDLDPAEVIGITTIGKDFFVNHDGN